MAVTAQPVNVTVCQNATATFTVAATGTGALSYLWQVSTDGGLTWNNLANGGGYAGVTLATLTITAANAMNGNLYRCQVTTTTPGAPPCLKITFSNPAMLTVTPGPTTGPNLASIRTEK